MTDRIDLDKVYAPSEDVVVREIEGEIVIVPLASGIGDLEDELFTLNETGWSIWGKVDGARSLAAVVRELVDEYEAPDGLIEEDVVGFLQELFTRGMIVEKG
jgi:hypothetical protein